MKNTLWRTSNSYVRKWLWQPQWSYSLSNVGFSQMLLCTQKWMRVEWWERDVSLGWCSEGLLFLHFPLVSFIFLTSSSLFLNLPFLSVHDLLKHIQLISKVNNMSDLSHFLQLQSSIPEGFDRTDVTNLDFGRTVTLSS